MSSRDNACIEAMHVNRVISVNTCVCVCVCVCVRVFNTKELRRRRARGAIQKSITLLAGNNKKKLGRAKLLLIWNNLII